MHASFRSLSLRHGSSVHTPLRVVQSFFFRLFHVEGLIANAHVGANADVAVRCGDR